MDEYQMHIKANCGIIQVTRNFSKIGPGFSNICKPENILTNRNNVHCSPQRTFLVPRSSFNAHFRIRSFLKGKRQKKSQQDRESQLRLNFSRWEIPALTFFCFLEDKYTYKQRAGVKNSCVRIFHQVHMKTLKSNDTYLFQ